jgi:hypothetical protein
MADLSGNFRRGNQAGPVLQAVALRFAVSAGGRRGAFRPAARLSGTDCAPPPSGTKRRWHFTVSPCLCVVTMSDLSDKRSDN